MMDRSVETILIVDDEALLRLVMADALEEAGYQVLQAENSESALATLRDNREIALLITDVNMPGEMDGFALVQQVHQDYPQMGVIVTSGMAAPSNAYLPDGGTFIPKPYSLRAVLNAVDAMVSKAARALRKFNNVQSARMAITAR